MRKNTAAAQKKLNSLRRQMDRVDRSLSHDLRQRQKLLDQIFELKLSHGLPLRDSARTQQILSRLSARYKPSEFRSFYKPIFKKILDCSLQHLNKKKTSCLTSRKQRKL